ncbi:hypothetical protein RHGRI_017928 [Rhododendron griersonianum]|uniref:Uncharacterized protein n=1 Tax=Rhododendron griersonianum TaxID=479676 RepID=A0AAV6JZR1_9ERIC|nr:hypothetical protein RHGRI_017928 [Rhododendron griersonianum]
MDSPDVDSLKDNLIGNLDYSNLCTTFEKPSTTPRRSPSEVTELIRVPADGSGELSLSVSMLCSYRFGCWSLSSHPLEYWRFPHDHSRILLLLVRYNQNPDHDSAILLSFHVVA